MKQLPFESKAHTFGRVPNHLITLCTLEPSTVQSGVGDRDGLGVE